MIQEATDFQAGTPRKIVVCTELQRD